MEANKPPNKGCVAAGARWGYRMQFPLLFFLSRGRTRYRPCCRGLFAAAFGFRFLLLFVRVACPCCGNLPASLLPSCAGFGSGRVGSGWIASPPHVLLSLCSLLFTRAAFDVDLLTTRTSQNGSCQEQRLFHYSPLRLVSPDSPTRTRLPTQSPQQAGCSENKTPQQRHNS